MPDITILSEETGLLDVVRQVASTTPMPDEVIISDEIGLPDAVHQDPITKPAPDIAILANEIGLPLEVVAKAIAFHEAFSKYAVDLINRFPNQISRIYADSPPGTISISTRGHIQFIGELPPGIASMENVLLSGGGMITMADHIRRVQLAARAMLDLGYHNLTSSFDPFDNLIRIELKLPEGVAQPSKSDLVGALQDRLQADPRLGGRAATVGPLDLDLIVSRGSGPIITSQHSQGES